MLHATYSGVTSLARGNGGGSLYFSIFAFLADDDDDDAPLAP